MSREPCELNDNTAVLNHLCYKRRLEKIPFNKVKIPSVREMPHSLRVIFLAGIKHHNSFKEMEYHRMWYFFLISEILALFF